MASLGAFDRSRLRTELRYLIMTDDEVRKILLELSTVDNADKIANLSNQFDEKIGKEVKQQIGSIFDFIGRTVLAGGAGISLVSIAAIGIYIVSYFNFETIKGRMSEEIVGRLKTEVGELATEEINRRNSEFAVIKSEGDDIVNKISKIEEEILLMRKNIELAETEIKAFREEMSSVRIEKGTISELTAALNVQIVEADRAVAKAQDVVKMLNSLTVDLYLLQEDKDGVVSSRYERAIDLALSAFAASRITTDGVLASLPPRYTYISPNSVGCERDYEEHGEVNMFELPDALKQFGDKGSIFFCKMYEDYKIFLSSVSGVIDPPLAAAAHDRFKQLAEECRKNAREMTAAAERAIQKTPAETYVLCERRPDRVTPDRVDSDAQ